MIISLLKSLFEENIISLLKSMFKEKKKSRRIPYYTYIPQDLLVDILSRLPVKSIIRFRAVHTSWLSLTSSRKFTLQHLRANNGCRYEYGFIHIGNEHTIYPSLSLRVLSRVIEEEEEDVDIAAHKLIEIKNFYGRVDHGTSIFATILGSCNGLLLIRLNPDFRNLVLWNPSTREHRKIEGKIINILRAEYIAGLGYDSLNDNYKIVLAIFYNNDQTSVEVEVEVYNLKTSCWKTKRYHLPYKFYSICNSSGITLGNGIIHWLVRRRSSDQKMVVLSFDLVKEKFKEIILPGGLSDFKRTLCLSTFDGYLCIGIRRVLFKPLNIWMMREYGVEKFWTKFNISFPDFYGCCSHFMPLGFIGKGQDQVVMTLDHQSIAIYYVNSQCYKTVLRSDDHELRVATYIESLVSPNYY